MGKCSIFTDYMSHTGNLGLGTLAGFFQTAKLKITVLTLYYCKRHLICICVCMKKGYVTQLSVGLRDSCGKSKVRDTEERSHGDGRDHQRRGKTRRR